MGFCPNWVMSHGGFLLAGGFVRRGICPRGFCPKGFLSDGGFVRLPILIEGEEVHQKQKNAKLIRESLPFQQTHVKNFAIAGSGGGSNSTLLGTFFLDE